MKKALTRSFNLKSISDFINFIAGVIGIFGFLTGISSIPLLLAASSGEKITLKETVWFGGNISLSLSIPVFVIALLFVYGIYFLVLIRVNKWLCNLNVITPSHEKVYSFDARPGDTFSVIFFMILGGAFGILLLRAFFYIPPDLYENNPGFVVFGFVFGPILVLLFILFLYWLCEAARDTGSRYY